MKIVNEVKQHRLDKTRKQTCHISQKQNDFTKQKKLENKKVMIFLEVVFKCNFCLFLQIKKNISQNKIMCKTVCVMFLQVQKVQISDTFFLQIKKYFTK